MHNSQLRSIAVDSAFLSPHAELEFSTSFSYFRHLRKVILQNTTREGLENILTHSPNVEVLQLHCLSGAELLALDCATSLTTLSLLYFKEAFMPRLSRVVTKIIPTLTSLDLEYTRKKEGLGIHYLTRLTNLMRLSIQCGVSFNVQNYTKTELQHLSHFTKLNTFKFHCDVMDGDVYNHVRSGTLENLLVGSNYFYSFPHIYPCYYEVYY